MKANCATLSWRIIYPSSSPQRRAKSRSMTNGPALSLAPPSSSSPCPVPSRAQLVCLLRAGHTYLRPWVFLFHFWNCLPLVTTSLSPSFSEGNFPWIPILFSASLLFLNCFNFYLQKMITAALLYESECSFLRNRNFCAWMCLKF